jgi:hypothetical protein
LAVTLEPKVLLKPVVGDHTYVLAPLAVNVVDVFIQILAAGTDITGRGFTVTTSDVVLVQPEVDVPNTV